MIFCLTVHHMTASPRNNRPTLRMIAKEAGLSVAATSMALRNHPRISAETRKHVQAVACRMGYHPDPKLATLMQHLRTHGNGNYRETLMYLSTYSSFEDWKTAPHYDYYLGAAERALDLGYRLDVIHLGEPGMTAARISHLLAVRGVRGILIGGFEEPESSLALDWKQFAAVAFDYSLISPRLHRVTTNYYLEMSSVLRRLAEEGCQRIGLNANSNDDAKVMGLWHSAFLYFEENIPPSCRVKVNFFPNGKSKLAPWLRRYKPDAIISAGYADFPQDYEEIYGESPPEDIRYVNMNIAYTDGRSRGVDKLQNIVGRRACEHLIALLQQNEVGLPVHPQVIVIEGEWVENYTAWKIDRENWRANACQKIAAFTEVSDPQIQIDRVAVG